MKSSLSTLFSFGMLVCGLVMLAVLTTGCTSIPASNRYQHGDFVRNLAYAAPTAAGEER